MEWVPESMWFTHLPLSTTADELGYDLAISTTPRALPALTDAGIRAPAATVPAPIRAGRALWPLPVGLGIGTLSFVLLAAPARPVDRTAGPTMTRVRALLGAALLTCVTTGGGYTVAVHTSRRVGRRARAGRGHGANPDPPQSLRRR